VQNDGILSKKHLTFTNAELHYIDK